MVQLYLYSRGSQNLRYIPFGIVHNTLFQIDKLVGMLPLQRIQVNTD